jgi:hypothetical protein
MGTLVPEMDDAEEEDEQAAVADKSTEATTVADPQQEQIIAAGSPHAHVKEVFLGGAAPFVGSPGSSNTPSVHVSIGGAVPEKGTRQEQIE